MANGERCRKCGFQETSHDLEPERTCGHFVSEVAHKKECPVINCSGNCEETIAQAEKASQEKFCEQERKFPH